MKKTEEIKNKHSVKVVVGNIAHGASLSQLVDAGADAVKVGAAAQEKANEAKKFAETAEAAAKKAEENANAVDKIVFYNYYILLITGGKIII